MVPSYEPAAVLIKNKRKYLMNADKLGQFFQPFSADGTLEAFKIFARELGYFWTLHSTQ